MFFMSMKNLHFGRAISNIMIGRKKLTLRKYDALKFTEKLTKLWKEDQIYKFHGKLSLLSVSDALKQVVGFFS